MSTVICPECGGKNTHYGRCDFCGGIIEFNVPEIIENTKEEDEIQEGDSVNFEDKIIVPNKVEGIFKINYDERVLTQENCDNERIYTYCKVGLGSLRYKPLYERKELTLPTQNEGQCNIGFYHIHFSDGHNHIFFGPYSSDDLIDVKTDKGSFDYIGNKILDLKKLLVLCEAKTISIKVGLQYLTEESVTFVVLLAQVYYNTFVDSSKYKDAAEKLYNHPLCIKEQELYKKEEEEKKEREKEWEREKERVNNQALLFIFLFAIATILYIVFAH